jgi:putative toxin-antitoxin system antitoxin component (TIGR02293 family)
MSASLQSNDSYAAAAALLGGEKVLRRTPSDQIEAHEMLAAGLPGRALHKLFDGLEAIAPEDALQKAIGISLRTYQRSQKAPAKPLSIDQSSRAWTFATVLAHAIRVFSSRHAAEEWLQRPAMALGWRKPIDLLATPEGVALVKTLLGRIEYGVYA